MVNYTNVINDINKEIKFSKILSESIDFSEFDLYEEEPTLAGDDIIQKEIEKSTENVGGYNNEINQIRKIALSVISKESDNPLSNDYDLFKKIWQMCDKSLTNSKQIEN